MRATVAASSAPPMFGVTVTWDALMKAMMDPDLHVDLLRLVHGEQDMEFPNPIRPGERHHRERENRFDRSQDYRRNHDRRAERRNQKGQPVQKTLFIIFIRGARKPRRCFVRTAPR